MNGVPVVGYAVYTPSAVRRDTIVELFAAVALIHEHGDASRGMPFREMKASEWRTLRKENPAEAAHRTRARNRYRMLVKAANAIAFIEKSEQRHAGGAT